MEQLTLAVPNVSAQDTQLETIASRAWATELEMSAINANLVDLGQHARRAPGLCPPMEVKTILQQCAEVLVQACALVQGGSSPT